MQYIIIKITDINFKIQTGKKEKALYPRPFLSINIFIFFINEIKLSSSYSFLKLNNEFKYVFKLLL